MKVEIFNYDRLRHSPDGFEMGTIPANVGLEALRWDGEKLVNLLDLTAIWCEQVDGHFVLHCMEVPGAQLVAMKYKNKKKLWNDNGVYKIKSDNQMKKELNLQYRTGHYPKMSDQMGAIMKHLETQPKLHSELETILAEIEAVKDKFPTTFEG